MSRARNRGSDSLRAGRICDFEEENTLPEVICHKKNVAFDSWTASARATMYRSRANHSGTTETRVPNQSVSRAAQSPGLYFFRTSRTRACGKARAV
jgi:hypothetical protein